MEKLWAGISRKENGIDVPEGAKEFLSKSNRKCYLSAVRFEEGKYIANIRYLDNGTFTDVDYNLIEKYL